jgi:MFS transporter, putative metabolite:H+ symporter
MEYQKNYFYRNKLNPKLFLNMVNDKRLFLASCFALITTAFSFSIRAGILPQLATEFSLSGQELGFINSMWFFGFPIAMIVGGLIYHTVGPKKIMQFAFITHAIGIILTLYPTLLGTTGYIGLLLSTFLIGLGNGCTEAACNPMIADTYSGDEMNKKLNRFHMWFPGGIVIGSLISNFMTGMNLGWQAQIWIILIPTVIYAFLFFGQTFPKPKVEGVTSIAENFKAMLSPLFIFMFVCMAFTAISEFGPQQWTSLIMSKSGANPMLILALVTGLMAVARYFGGSIIGKFDQTGVLLGGAILATIGIYLFSTQTGPMAYVAAVFFALGVAYFWPTMIGFVAERIPLSGALGMSIIGGVGMFSTSIFQPIIGGWIDSDLVAKEAEGKTGEALELAAGQATLGTMVTFPVILIVLFTVLYFWQKGKKPAKMSASH